jgi:hypothetical protein
MCPATDNLTSCEIRNVICFLHDKNMSAVEIHRDLCAAVYGQKVMSEGTVRQWCKKCSKMGEQMLTMKSEVDGHL